MIHAEKEIGNTVRKESEETLGKNSCQIGPDGMEVLIADDDPSTLRLLESALTKWGFDPIAVRDGGLAWDMLQKKHPPPIAILDRNMPSIDGASLCRTIRQSTQIHPIYVILLTAMDDEKDIVDGLRAGADDYITKPFSFEELQARIHVGVRVVKLEQALMDRVQELEDMLLHIRRLHGLLPICTYCKKICNDDNSWQPLEKYIREHSNADFSHGICPDCYAEIEEGRLKPIAETKEELSPPAFRKKETESNTRNCVESPIQIKYFSIEELSLYLNRPKSWIYSHAPYLGVKDGKQWIFTKEWVDEYFESLRHKSKGKSQKHRG